MTPGYRFRRYLGGIAARRRLFASVILACGFYLVLPEGWRPSTRVLLAWDVGVVLYLGFMGQMMLSSNIDDIRRRAPLYDEASLTILLLTIGAICASLWAIVVELAHGNRGGLQAAPTVLAGATVMLSWTMTHMVFAMHYAHEYYAPHPDGERGGLRLPENADPAYQDFVYTAFVIGCAAQTADVSFTSPAMRRIALIHGIVAFVFNTALLALTVNIAASLLGQ